MNKFKHLLLICFMLLGVGTSQLFAQSTITGTVKDSEGESLPGATVAIKGTQKGTQTDIDGKYSIEVPAGSKFLTFSFVGYKMQEIEIGNRSTIDVSLELEGNDEVIVTGYSPQLKKTFVGAASVIDAESMEKLPILTINQGMQGQAAGVQVVSSSGLPGGGISVRVRGQTSLSAGNNPLYVIDGVPMVNGNLGQVGFGGQNTSSLAGLNPDDIESMQVLKDAAATAIYGARAANGVVVITTKRGKTGRPTISFNYTRSWGKETNRITMLNSSQYATLRNEARRNDGFPEIAIDTTINTNWLNEVFKIADIADYQVTVSGGEGKTRYYASVAHRNEQAIIIGSQFNRYNARVNTETSASEGFIIRTSMAGSYDLNNRINNDNNIFGVLSTAMLCPPNVPVFTKDGEYGAWQFANPVATALEPRYANTNLKFTGNMNFAYRLFKGKKKNEDLKLMLDLSTDYNGYIEDHYEPPTTTQGIPSGVGVYTSRNILRYVVEPYLIYKGSFDEDNTFNLVAGMTFQKTTDQSSFTVGEVFPTAFNSLTYVASAAQVNSGSSNIDRRGFQSYFGRFSYSFKEKYNVDVSGRADGSGAFGPDRRYGMFWSVGAGWIISDEAFFEDLSETVNLLKLRASYGLVGNDQIGNNIWQKSWGVTDYNGMPASNVARIGNPALSWESSNKFDVGVEAAFFQDKVSVNLGFYNTNTTGLLFAKQFPSSTGFFSQTYNIGKSNNRGVELEVRGSPINRSTTGGLKWDVNVNLAYSTNEVVELVDEEPIISGFGSAVLIGRPFNSFYALKSTGVDPATGNMMYEDVNGDGIFNQEDYQFLGAGFTPFYGGITNTLSWKNLSLDMFWQVNIGNEIYNSNWEFIQSMGSAVWNQDASTLNRWRQAGDVTDVPRAGIGSAEAVQNNLRSSRFVLDGSFGRLKNLALSYTVPKDLLKKAKIESLRLTLSGQNLWTITRYAGFDPEVSTFGESNSAAGTDFLTLPQLQMFTAGINLKF